MFKSISLYARDPITDLSAVEVESILEQNSFKELSALEERTYGYTPIHAELSTFKKGKGVLFAIQTEFKPINKKAINQEATKKIKLIQENENRKVQKAEKETIVNDIYHDVLLKTLPVSEVIHVYLSEQFVAIDTTSSKKAEDVLSYLRSIFGTLSVIPLIDYLEFNNEFTNWVLTSTEVPTGVVLKSPFKLIRESDVDGSTETVTLNIVNTNDPGLPSIKEYLSTFNVATLALSVLDYQFALSDKLIVSNCKSTVESDGDYDEGGYYLTTDMIESIYTKLTSWFKHNE